jgi:UDP-N-acetylglucosamine 2-epimerase (non-hydrolysing)
MLGEGPASIVYVYGARPNFVKMAPVIRALSRRLPAERHVSVHTGQHYDAEMSAIFFEELGLPAPDHDLGVGSGTHAAQTASAMVELENVLLAVSPAFVVVAGDVNSTLAAALVAVKLGIPVAHVEAGLRSFDRTMPEEVNRVLVDQVSAWCFVHSPEAVENLRREGVHESRIHTVGNTMIDTLVQMRPAVARSQVHERLGVSPGDYILVTLHRPALVDGPLLANVLSELDALSRTYPVVFPMHPRTRARANDFRRSSASFHLVDPLGYADFLALETFATGVVTDSGGVQEETTYLGVPCFTIRENTERPITVTEGTNRILGMRVEALRDIPILLGETSAAHEPPDGWDGHAAERIAEILAGAQEQMEVRDAALVAVR